MIQKISIKPVRTYKENKGCATQKAQSGDTFKSIMKSAAKNSDKTKDDTPKADKTEKKDLTDKTQSLSDISQNPVLKGNSTSASDSVTALQMQNAAGKNVETVLTSEQNGQTVSSSGALAKTQAVKSNTVGNGTKTNNLISEEQTAQIQQEQTATQAEQIPEKLPKGAENVVQIEAVQPQQVKDGKAQKSSALNTTQNISDEAQADSTQPQKTSNLHKIVQNKNGLSKAGEKAKTDFNIQVKANADPESTKSIDGKKSSQPASLKAEVLSEKSDKSSANTAVGNIRNLYSDGNVVIKVSNASANAKPSVSQQVADTVSYQIKNGKKEFQMNLFPKSLGKVSVKMTTENGILTIEIAALNPKTQSLLMANSGDVKSLLQTSTGQTVQVLKQEQSQWQNQQQNGGYGRQPQQQQQQQQQDSVDQNRQVIFYDGKNSNMNTGDFLSIMQQLSVKSY